MQKPYVNLIIELLKGASKQTLQTIAVAVLIVGALLLGIKYLTKTTHIGTENKAIVTSTPTSIDMVKDIGQWEFLTITNEEMVDTVKKSLLGSSELIRIYFGTLRLGIDLSDTIANWLTAHGDTVNVVLPKVRLLDDDFIDEARTLSFYETGKWSAKEMDEMRLRAERQMRARCLTEENMDEAKASALLQMENMLKSFRYKTIDISFAE